jgi:hypothetical protein
MIPTLRTTLGLKGHRPIVGNLDCHDLVYVMGALNLVTGRLTTRLVERCMKSQPLRSTQRYLQRAFARHLRDLGRAYPPARFPRVVLVIDNAPWHHGSLITTALHDVPHLQLYRLPSYSPQLQVIERFWRVLRRRATHNRLFPALAQLKQALRHSLCYYQTLKHRVLSLVQSPKKRTHLRGLAELTRRNSAMQEMLGKYWSDLEFRKIPYRGPLDDAGIPLLYLRRHRRGDPPIYHPVAILQYALAHYNLALSGNAAAEAVFMRCARWVEENAVEEPRHRFLVWPYGFPLRTPPVRPPWISGMAQGEALSVLARAFLRTGSSRTADVARQAAQVFLYTISDGGVITRAADGRCFIEEIASPPALHILNGCLTGVFGLYEHLCLFPDAKLQAVLEAVIEGVAHWLPAFDTGYWSRYSLGVRWHLADAHYHKTHIHQLRYLGGLFSRPVFLSRADQWQEYERSRFNRARQRMTKALELHGNRGMTVLRLNGLKYRGKEKLARVSRG